MAEEFTLKRVIAMTDEASSPSSDQYMLVDSDSGAKKMQVEKLMVNEAPAFSTSETYAAGDIVIYNAKLYEFTAAHAAGAWIGTDAQQITLGGFVSDVKSDFTELSGDLTEVQAEVATKANADGVAENLTSGQTKQLLSDVYATDSEPYFFRPTGGNVNSSAGDREYDTIVGGTVAWNQLLRNGDFTAKQNWSVFQADYAVADNEATITQNGTADGSIFQDLTVPDGHKMFVSAFVKNGTGTKTALYFRGNVVKNITATAYEKVETVYSAGGNNRVQIVVSGDNGTGYAKNIIAIDLTALFGTTIADYIYSLETATTGAGVAFFRKLFPKDYYPYDAGTLKSVEGLSAHETVGFNQWDEEWELGTIDGTTGEKISDSSVIRSKNFIPVLPDTQYCMRTESLLPSSYIFMYGYDANKGFVGRITFGSQVGTLKANLLTIPSNVFYLMFRGTSTYGTTYNNDICINLHWDGERDGEYEEYTKHSYPLDDSLTLRGIMKLDAQNRPYFDGDVYEADGTVTRRYGIVDLGTLNWAYSTSIFNASVPNFAQPSDYLSRKTGFICSNYTADTQISISEASMQDKSALRLSGSIYIKDTAYTDAAAFKSAMSGVYMVYELATPTTETAEPFQSPQIVDDFGTEEYITTSIVPVGHTTKYPENLRAKIEGLPWDFSTLIAPTEKTNTATRNYTTGSLLIMGNVLYKVTANIANGGTITPGTNVTATTLSEVISALS